MYKHVLHKTRWWSDKFIFLFIFAVRFVERLYQQKIQICLLDDNQYLYSGYSNSRKTAKTKFWRCAQRTQFKCEALCTTIFDRMKNFKGVHNHGPNFDETTMALKVIENVKEELC